jgi:hypothetical protein
MSAWGQTRSFGDIGPMSGLPESGHGRIEALMVPDIVGLQLDGLAERETPPPPPGEDGCYRPIRRSRSRGLSILTQLCKLEVPLPAFFG